MGLSGIVRSISPAESIDSSAIRSELPLEERCNKGRRRPVPFGEIDSRTMILFSSVGGNDSDQASGHDSDHDSGHDSDRDSDHDSDCGHVSGQNSGPDSGLDSNHSSVVCP